MNRPRVQASAGISHLALPALTLLVLLLIACNLQAQSSSTLSDATAQSAHLQAGAPSQSPAPNELTQMRIDLDRMESLLGNMSAEIEFLRDQNLQILLRSNAQMWTILIRDLRRQIDREEQQRSRVPRLESAPPETKATPR